MTTPIVGRWRRPRWPQDTDVYDNNAEENNYNLEINDDYADHIVRCQRVVDI